MEDRYREQGEGPFQPGRGIDLIELLESRDGVLTLLELEDGRVLRAFNSCGSRDMGEEWEHTTLNISPFLDGEDSPFVLTGEVVRAIDPETSAVLYTRTYPYVRYVHQP